MQQGARRNPRRFMPEEGEARVRSDVRGTAKPHRDSPLLEESLLSRWIAGMIRAGTRRDAAILCHADTRVPTGAEIVGTGSRPWRGMAAGSLRFPPSGSPPHTMAITESAIDALSAFLITSPGRCPDRVPLDNRRKTEPAQLDPRMEPGTDPLCLRCRPERRSRSSLPHAEGHQGLTPPAGRSHGLERPPEEAHRPRHNKDSDRRHDSRQTPRTGFAVDVKMST